MTLQRVNSFYNQPRGKWVLGELRGACNKEAGIETYRTVEEWLEDRQEAMGNEHS